MGTPLRRGRAAAALAAVLTAFFTPCAAGADPTWPQIRDATDWSTHGVREHVDAGTVEVLRTTIADVPCFQATCLSDMRPETGLELARDVEGIVEWATNGMAEGEVLAGQGQTLEYYQLMDVPEWTMTRDRFWFLRGKTVREGGATVWVWERLVDGGDHAERHLEVVAAHPKAIEPPVNAGAWWFEPEGDSTRIRYFICSTAGGSLPVKLQTMATTATLPDTVGDFVREGRRREAARD